MASCAYSVAHASGRGVGGTPNMTGKLLTHAERFRWIEGVLANPAFTHAQARVLVRLAMHLNVATGRCDPAINTIAVGAAVSSRAVKATLGRRCICLRQEGRGTDTFTASDNEFKSATRSRFLSGGLYLSKQVTRQRHGQSLTYRCAAMGDCLYLRKGPAGSPRHATALRPSWVIHVISNVREGLPVYTQHRTYRCTALTDEKGQ